MKQRKWMRLAVFILTLSMLLSLVACDVSGDAEAQTTEKPSTTDREELSDTEQTPIQPTESETEESITETPTDTESDETSLDNTETGSEPEQAESNKPDDGIDETETTENSENDTTDTETEEENVFDLVDFTISVPEDREPVILQLTDTQIIDSTGTGKWDFWAADKMGVECFDYLTEIVNATKPDLILLTGDLVYGQYDSNGTSLLALIELMEGFDIPWAPVFGNHEAESAKGIDWQCAQLEAAENCLFLQRTLTGNGNYTVGIEQGGKLTRVFFMLDSNGCNNPSTESYKNTHLKTYSGFGNDQIKWYTGLIGEIKAISPETKLSFAFHIQLKVFLDSFSAYLEEDTDTVFIDLLDEKSAGDFGFIGDERNVGFDTDYKVWNGLKALGVDSIFVGHMHSQSASIVYEGVRLQFGMKSSTYDRINYVNSNGTIEAGYRLGGKTPWVGGSIMKLSADGAISEGYIYYCKNAGGNIDWDAFKPDTSKCDHAENTNPWIFDESDPQYEKSTCSVCGEVAARTLKENSEGLLLFSHDFIKDKTTDDKAFAEIRDDGPGGMEYVRFTPINENDNKSIYLHVNKAKPYTNVGGYVAVLYRTSVNQKLICACVSDRNGHTAASLQHLATDNCVGEWNLVVHKYNTHTDYDGENLATFSIFPFSVKRTLEDYTDIAYIGFFSSEEEALEFFSLYNEAYGLGVTIPNA